MSQCLSCGVELKDNRKICHTCYLYFKNGGVEYDLPKYGEVIYTSDDKVVCHICGRAYNKLSEHVKRKHLMSDLEYRKLFGLTLNVRLTSQKYHDKMRDYSEIHKTYEKNFKTDHKFVNGHKSRTGQKQSAHEINKMREEQRRKAKMSKKNLTPEQIKERGEIWKKNLPQFREVAE